MTSRPRIAVDVQFGPADITNLKLAGYDVVAQAEPGEPDYSWLSRAAHGDAEMICSPDSDAEIWAYDNRVRFCKVPGNRKCDLALLVMRAWTMGDPA